MEIISLYPRGAVVREWKWQGRRSNSVTVLPGVGCHIKISSSEVYLYFLLKVTVGKKKAQIVLPEAEGVCMSLRGAVAPGLL